MAAREPSTVPVGQPPAGPVEQLLVMHCLKEDSVIGREGFSVRAASPGASDPATLDWALKLDAYELPLDMKSGTLLANQAPRRLARVPGPRAGSRSSTRPICPRTRSAAPTASSPRSCCCPSWTPWRP